MFQECSDGSWREVAAQKEQEWRDVLEQHVNSLEVALNNKERQLIEEKRRFELLREDFEYNLQIISERDVELEKYEAIYARMKQTEAAHDGKVSELLISLDEKKTEVEMEKGNHEELRNYYQQRLKQKELEGEQWRLEKETAMRAERDDCERLKRRLQQQISDLSIDLDAQRRELNATFDEALLKKEQEYQRRLDELHDGKLAAESEAKQLRQEVEMMRVNQRRIAGELESECGTRQDTERRMKELQWEVVDVASMKDAKIADLELEIQQLQRTVLKCQEERNSLNRIVNERQSQLNQLQQSAVDRERELKSQMSELQSQLEMCKVQQQQLQWAHKDAMTEKDKQIQKTQTVLSDCQKQLDSQRAESSRTTVTRDLEKKKLLEEKKMMEIEVASKQEAINRYKQELAAGIERERDMEQLRVQLELEFDQKCRERERVVTEQQEQLISGLCEARDEAFGKVRERELELKQRDELISRLARERDQAVNALQSQPSTAQRAHTDGARGFNVPDVYVDRRLDGSGNIDHLYELDEQNKKLRLVIRQMREDMESMNQLRREDSSLAIAKPPESTDSRMEEMIEERRKIVAENESLKQQIEELSVVNRQLAVQDTESGRQKPDGPLMRAQLRAMNETIGALRAEKLELAAESQRLQTKVTHLSSMLTKTEEEIRAKQVLVEQLQYESVTSTRRSTAETAELKRRATELELSLKEAQHVADEYHKSSVEKNAEVTALRNEVSALKLDVASRADGGMSVQHAAVVADLEDEIQQLRKQLSSRPVSAIDGYNSTFRQKLKVASRRILELTRERQQLIDISNTMRAEAQKPKDTRSSDARYQQASVSRVRRINNSDKTNEQRDRRGLSPGGFTSREAHDRSLRDLAGKLDNKLNAVERLHYQLTRQELQQSQRQAQTSGGERRYHGMHSKHDVSDTNDHLYAYDRQMEKEPAHADSDLSGGFDVLQQLLLAGDIQTQHAQSDLSGSLDDGHQSSLRGVWDVLAEGEQAVAGFTPRNSQTSTTGDSVSKGVVGHTSGDGELVVAGHRARMMSHSETMSHGMKRRELKGKTAVVGRSRETKNVAKLVRNYSRRDQ